MSKPERPNTVSGLIDKRREIAGQIEHTQRELQRGSSPTSNIAICVFDQDAVPGTAKCYPPSRQAIGGHMSRFVMAELREAKRPYTTLDWRKSIERQGMAGAPKPPKATRDRVGSCLNRLRHSGIATTCRQRAITKLGRWCDKRRRKAREDKARVGCFVG